MNRKMNRITVKVSLIISIVLVSISALAGGERVWELAGETEMMRGEVDGTLVTSKGEVKVGYTARPIDLEPTGLVWKAIQGPNGKIYMGTGYEGKLYRLDGDKATLIATTDAVAVTDMVFDIKGNLYLSALPSNHIFKIETPHKIKAEKPIALEPYATLPKEALHIWSLAFNTDGVLFVGTGPNGAIYSVGKDRIPEIYIQTEEKHILTLLATDKAIFAGTSPGALLLRADGPGVGFTLADFNGAELVALEQLASGDLVAAVNRYDTSKSKSKTKSTSKPVTTSSKSVTGASSSTSKSSARKPGASQIYTVSQTGETQQLHELDDANVASLATTKDDTVWLGLDTDGRIVGIDRRGTTMEVANFEQRQVMSVLADDDLFFAATADTGAAYQMRKGDRDATYLSPVLNAETNATWGRLRWFANGEIKIFVRSGNTETPDKTWSVWSKATSQNSIVPAPQAKYLQLKLSFSGAPDAALRSLRLTYLPQNQKATIASCSPDSPFKDTKSSRFDTEHISTRTVAANDVDGNTKKQKINWTVRNPDNDRLRTRMYYRTIDDKHWIPLFREDYIHTKDYFFWETHTAPDGIYQIKLHVDDSLDNPTAKVLHDEFVCVPFTIDNNAPSIDTLTYNKGIISGIAKDSFSNIGSIELSINNAPWIPIEAQDGMLDQTSEKFRIQLKEALPPGVHVITIRATDVIGNYASDEIQAFIK